ncbi:hypothetical protein WN55_02293, partial [Dufourea novaeangliae]
MSGSGFRGRGFGPRGARSNGPSNGFSGPRFPHPSFNHPRPPHRLSGPEKWVEGPNFKPWQQNKGFLGRPQYRGNLQFRPNGRSRAANNGRGIVRFPGPGRPSGPQFCMGFVRNSGPRLPLPPQEEQIIEAEKSLVVPQTPLLGSEEERQQKITETADKLKEKLSSITEEDMTNFWEDDLSLLPNSGSEEGIVQMKGIPELRHEPPELDLTFTDFRDIGRVDCNNSKFDSTDDTGNNDDILITYEDGTVGNTVPDNYEAETKTLQLENVDIVETPQTSNIDMEEEDHLSVHDLDEKMTLYEMLTNDDLTANNDFEDNNAAHERKEIEISLVRPRTPSALMSKLIQNIEAGPVTNQCAKTTTENVPLKDSAVHPVQPNKSKVPRHEQHAVKKTNSISTCSSENEEIARHNHTRSPSLKRRKRHRGSDRATKTENKLECIKETSVVNIVEKKTNNTVKPILKKVAPKPETTEQHSNQALIGEIKSQKDVNHVVAVTNPKSLSDNDKPNTPSGEESEKTAKQTEPHISIKEVDKSKTVEVSSDKLLLKENDDKALPANDMDTASSAVKTQENRTPEQSSIYSDDSTWDSLVQVPSDDQKKPATGLALLEETYRKEMAKTRKTKADARRRRKKRGMRGLLYSIAMLTPEEEELPLSALYVKKLHSKKKANTSDEQAEKANEHQLDWTNVDEVINAVAENRLEDLYVEKPEEPSEGNNESNVPDVDSTLANKEHVNEPEILQEPDSSVEEKKTLVVSFPLKNIEEDNLELSTELSECPTSSDDKIDAGNNVQLTVPLSNIQVPSNSEEQPQGDLINVESQDPEASRDATMSIETNIIEPVQQTTESEKLEIEHVTSTEDRDLFPVESVTNDTYTDQSISNIPEADVNTEKTEEENTDKENTESAPIEDVVNVDSTVSVNPEEVATIPDAPEKRDDNTIKSIVKIMVTASEISICTQSENNEPKNVNDETSKDSLPKQEDLCEKEHVRDDREESTDPSKDEHFISLKDHRVSHRRRESERSNKSSSEENNNRNRTPVPHLVEATDPSKSDDTSSKKSSKRKRGSSRTPLRRSSRYTEETTKRIKLEVDATVQPQGQDSQEKDVQIQLSSVSPVPVLSSHDEETENTSTSGRRSRNQKTAGNRKRCVPPEIDVLPNSSSVRHEDLNGVKRYKQHTMPEMMNCKVRLVDC